ncbi:MAG TPA: peptidase S10 [Bryobacteraceae bacterium]|nr:peptidase S10 [Bryobacterales bacterium]HRJ20727.1 peptidase S10 [Bryobacteraceae bacterium]
MLRCFLALCALPLLAQQNQAPAPKTPDETPVVRQHEITLKGRTLKYTTTTGLMPIRNAEGVTEAHIFYMAYTLDGVTDPAKRRLMFSFNGGPGSSSVWLHLGALGPKRAKMLDDGALPAAPYQLVPNEETWLDETDIVFIDPVGTGYSRAVKPDLLAKFTSRNGDIQSVGEFIRLYLTRHKRWLSPLFLVGESYGTTRAAGLAGHLIDRGIAFNGIALVSTILNFQTARFTSGNDLPYPLILPTYTATAHYHKRLPANLQRRPLRDLLKEVEKWALGPYSEALAKGDALTPAERQSTAAQLAAYTGLDAKFVDQGELRISLPYFNRALLRDRNLLVGRLDSRLTGPGPRSLAATYEFDPSMSAIRPPYTAAFNHYVRAELGYESDVEYHILGGGIQRWNSNSEGEYVNVSDALRAAFARNPHMKVYLGAGFYDMATPYFAAYYTLDHMGLAPEVKANIRIHEYEAGHMYYIHLPALAATKRDATAFLQWAAPLQ